MFLTPTKDTMQCLTCIKFLVFAPISFCIVYLFKNFVFSAPIKFFVFSARSSFCVVCPFEILCFLPVQIFVLSPLQIFIMTLFFNILIRPCGQLCGPSIFYIISQAQCSVDLAQHYLQCKLREYFKASRSSVLPFSAQSHSKPN